MSREMSEGRERLMREIGVEHRRGLAGGMFLLQAIAQRSGTNLTDLQCMYILGSTGPITAGRLAEITGLTTGAITGVINRLEGMGYVRREKDPGDARRVVVRPVGEGSWRAVALGSGDRGLEELLSGYGEGELAAVLEFVRGSNAVTERETARMRAASQGEEGGEFATPLGSVESGRLVFANGASRLILRAASGMDELYRARFESPAPKVTVDGGTVTLRYPRRLFGLFDWHDRPGEVTLNAAVPWEVDVRGGAARVEADLGGLLLTSLVLRGGGSDLTLALPEPSGTVPVHLHGGASKVSLRRPAGAAVGLSVRGGAARLVFDEQSFDALGGKVRLQSPGFGEATDRYEIEVSGGASEVSIR